MPTTTATKALLIGGRSGVGKSTVALAIHDILSAGDVAHAIIEGDNLDLAHPAPWGAYPEALLAERNLAAMWTNYRDLGYGRLVYTNTAAVVTIPQLRQALGEDAEIAAVLLQGSDEAVRGRLAQRERGASFDAHLARSAAAAVRLEAHAPESVMRIDTTGRTPEEVAVDILRTVSWLPHTLSGSPVEDGSA
ncbi:Broad-specificity NMP kinase [Leifsonia sp. 98AMF]|uniref:ATPase n=1 Tax=unclassified Leifsonia TaxID=2663824 RepID=UPI00087ACFFA|nr:MULTISPECIES: ATPase [unclassified Leifsonia]SDH35056.1 Broad-specificity NMP kinase [Leifsonia sp. 197AMF]SDJ00503.1 Broad-specificity NMP kinase [Leifsonia sp. 466MF]SDJ73692.1 Broad-specificity NMP kinase [Leifsonia sp. 157MF]SDO03831.1 Broad-specificity NMP kinase [Leifsonia sp. 509MF]SEN00125.1 Broad-specificity NMP kinase [Leifsonia sp. 467MF]